jgi:hypothetical protein
MEAHDRAELEAQIRIQLEGDDASGAITTALRGYGPEIFGLLVTLHRSEEDASEVFSQFAEQLWGNISRFAWQCSFRTWAYAVPVSGFLQGAGGHDAPWARSSPLKCASERAQWEHLFSVAPPFPGDNLAGGAARGSLVFRASPRERSASGAALGAGEPAG